MKTLTLFRACYFANAQVGAYDIERMTAHNPNSFIYRTKQRDKKIRQRNKFFHAVQQRLQEQEKELEDLRHTVAWYRQIETLR